MRLPRYKVNIWDTGEWHVTYDLGYGGSDIIKKGKSDTVDFADLHARDAIREHKEKLEAKRNAAPKLARSYTVKV